ncbi:hypothetical protein [Streptomyces sp. NPDC054842]
MTTPTSRSRARVACAVAGVLLSVGRLSVPAAAASTGVPAGATERPGAVAGPAVPVSGAAGRHADEDGSSTADLVLPLVTVAVAGTLASYGYLRRVRRSRTRTTPGGAARSHRAGLPGGPDRSGPPDADG